MQERNQNFEEHYFQEYSGAIYEKVKYPPEELKCCPFLKKEETRLPAWAEGG